MENLMLYEKKKKITLNILYSLSPSEKIIVPVKGSEKSHSKEPCLSLVNPKYFQSNLNT